MISLLIVMENANKFDNKVYNKHGQYVLIITFHKKLFEKR